MNLDMGVDLETKSSMTMDYTASQQRLSPCVEGHTHDFFFILWKLRRGQEGCDIVTDHQEAERSLKYHQLKDATICHIIGLEAKWLNYQSFAYTVRSVCLEVYHMWLFKIRAT